MKKALISVLLLAMVAALAGTVITYVNDLTEPIIEANAAREEKAGLLKIFPDGEFIELEGYSDNDYILSVYEVKGKGYIVKAAGYGYNTSTPVIVLIGFDNDGRTIGMIVLQQQETSGYGARCFEKTFIEDTYVNKTSDDMIDTLSGATRTSSVMKKIMEAAFEAVAEVK
ncbi:MAG: FMN-binding protein [Erysipelotrichaceae bacterium]|nr:FMN-binding protein [Erysipelotrichaceae bacterium]